MVRHVVDVVHGAELEEQLRFVILTRLARRRSRLGAGRIELMSMIRSIISSVTLVALAIAIPSSAYAGFKLTLAYITKWEVIDNWKVVGYAGETPYVFVDFYYMTCPMLKVGGNFVLRTFSPSIQGGDTVIVNGKSCRVDDVKGIRQN